MRVEQQIAVVTGGGSGLGAACCQALVASGARVVIWDRQQSRPSACLAIECDVSSESAVEEALKRTIAEVGVPRIGINCAGIAPAKRMVGRDGPIPLAAFKQVIEVNLIGTFNVMRVLAHAMTHLSPLGDSMERGIIINTASIAAYEGQVGQSAYSASKGGVVSMTLPIARELAMFGIRVNTIAPGLMATPMLLSMPDDVQTRLADTMLFPKRLGQPEEFAALALHLIENTFMNGAVIRLDGGLRMS